MNLEARPRWQGIAATAAVALAVTALVGATAHSIPAEPGTRAIDRTGFGIGALAAWSLLLRWVHPWLMLLVVVGLLSTYWGMGFTGGPALISGPLAVLSLGLVRPRRELVMATLVAVVVPLAVLVLVDGDVGLESSIAMLAVYVGAALAAEVARQRAERRGVQAEVRRRQQGQALAEQQLTLARDLHDGLAHALTGIAVQASIIERTAERDPSGAASAAASISQSSRSALADLNAIVKSLRDPADATRTPSRDLADIPGLVEQGRDAGQRITLRLDEVAASGQPPDRQLAAYRLVQEALTNAIRYAPGSSVAVLVESGDGLRVVVCDDGAGGEVPTSPGAGHGLVGMAERVSATGGTLRHGPIQPRGFEVRAEWERA